MGTQEHDRSGVADLLNRDDYDYDTEGMKDAISSEPVDGAEFQDTKLPRCGLSPTPLTTPTGSSAMEIEPSNQRTSVDTLPEATTDQSEQPVHRMAEEQGE